MSRNVCGAKQRISEK
nr:unnamed protein product [Callosobruchus chinensis]